MPMTGSMIWFPKTKQEKVVLISKTLDFNPFSHLSPLTSGNFSCLSLELLGPLSFARLNPWRIRLMLGPLLRPPWPALEFWNLHGSTATTVAYKRPSSRRSQPKWWNNRHTNRHKNYPAAPSTHFWTKISWPRRRSAHEEVTEADCATNAPPLRWRVTHMRGPRWPFGTVLVSSEQISGGFMAREEENGKTCARWRRATHAPPLPAALMGWS